MPDGDIENVLITLIRQYEVQGKVENADDESIGDYRVKALFQHPDGQSSEPLISKPENNGSFTVRCFGSGKWIAGLFDGRNTLAGETREFTLSPREEPPFITLSPGVPYDVNGRVLDHEGAALPQARVRIKGGMSAQETISDAAGVFFFKSFEKTFKASAESEKYTQAIEEDVSLPLDGELVLKFSMGKILSGIVVERDGNPVPGASITCQWLDLSTLVNRRNTVRADKDGRFRFTDINADFISILTAEAADVSDEKTRAFTRITMTDLPLPNPDLRIVLGSASKIHITILDDQNQNYNGEVTLVIKMWNPESVSYIDRDRVLRKVEEGRCSLDDLEPGNYVINAGNPEGLTGVSDGFECTGDPEGYEVQIRLNRPDEIDGHVYDEASGSP
ncbi:MAG TPA: carboxypeptidase-like regulatory domain-containing protein, partial [Candidatus Sumerlaeota bacterium]|nr:carboxypeptidase-like regulatory domain-containing protein [Candidatus Sumerlaeota bacterium]